jgi:hypothetical protein
MAYLRESDLLRVRDAGLLSKASQTNPYAQEILRQMQSAPGSAWLALSWRQYLHWFADFEGRFQGGKIVPDHVLKQAETTWDRLEAGDILMEERQNDGKWIRAWRRAILEARKA